MQRLVPLFAVLIGVAACGSEDQFPVPGTSKPEPGTSKTDAGTSKSRLPKGAPDVLGDGSADSVTLTQVYQAPDDMFCSGPGRCPGLAADLKFNPSQSDELWVVYRRPYANQPCDEPVDGVAGPNQAGCTLLRGMVAIITDATTSSPSVELKEDGNSWHFMRLVTALAFAEDETFATVGEARTGNWLNQSPDYMGPTLWSSDPDIFAHEFTTTDANGDEVPLNGSHLDMLHATPFGMGIAHERDHVFWCFNGQIGSVDRYDFHAPHEPGGEDHSDGELERYVPGQLKRQENVPSHMDFGPKKRYLYIADSGSGRILRLDTQSGVKGARITVQDPQIADPRAFDGATLDVLVDSKDLLMPSGLTVYQKHIIVSDVSTGKLHMFDLEGSPVVSWDTGLGAGALAGLTVGPDGRLYLVDWAGAGVQRVELTQ